MSWSLEELKKVTPRDVSYVVMAFLGSIAPGYLVMFILFTDLAKELETFKLIVLSASISLPIVALHTAFALLFLPIPKGTPDEMKRFGAMTFGQTMTILSFLMPLISGVQQEPHAYALRVLSISAGSAIAVLALGAGYAAMHRVMRKRSQREE